MDILIILLSFVIIFALIVVLVLFFAVNRPYSYNRRVKGEESIFTMEAKKPVASIEVVGKFGNNEEIKFNRKNIQKGEKIEFVYPASATPASVTIEIEKGKPKTFEV